MKEKLLLYQLRHLHRLVPGNLKKIGSRQGRKLRKKESNWLKKSDKQLRHRPKLGKEKLQKREPRRQLRLKLESKKQRQRELRH